MDVIDSTFSFMTVDWDGQIRMDPSSVYAMARMVGLKERFDVAFASDTDADRHGIVSRSHGLLDPNHHLSEPVARRAVSRAWSSVAAIAIAPLQDFLNLGTEARMNVPGRADGNWTWRCTQEMLSGHEFESLCQLTRKTNRLDNGG